MSYVYTQYPIKYFKYLISVLSGWEVLWTLHHY